MAKRGIEFDITAAGTDLSAGANPYVRRLLRPLHRGPVLEWFRDTGLHLSLHWRRRQEDALRRTRSLVQVICELNSARMIVDSSKVGLRLKYLLRDPMLDVKVVRLIRDGRAVALTYHKPVEYADARDARHRGGGYGGPGEDGLSMRAAARDWRRSNEEAECILAGTDRSRWTEVRYEELCGDPDATLDRLFRFLGVDPAARDRDYRVRCGHVVGNGMRMDSTAQIVLDERWRSVLRNEDLRAFNAEAGEMNRRYGYG